MRRVGRIYPVEQRQPGFDRIHQRHVVPAGSEQSFNEARDLDPLAI
jgi:hypothetical protein